VTPENDYWFVDGAYDRFHGSIYSLSTWEVVVAGLPSAREAMWASRWAVASCRPIPIDLGKEGVVALVNHAAQS